MKTFKAFLDESIEKEPYLGTYIHFCKVLSGSGTSETEILRLFNKYMPEDEYDKPEKKELLDFLYKVAHDKVEAD